MINIVLKEGNGENLELLIYIKSYILIQFQNSKEVSLLIGLVFAASSLWTKVVLLLGGAKVKFLKILMAKMSSVKCAHTLL